MAKKPLGKFFTKTKGTARTKPAVKANPIGTSRNQEPADISGDNFPNGACRNADPGEASPGGNQEVPRRVV